MAREKQWLGRGLAFPEPQAAKSHQAGRWARGGKDRWPQGSANGLIPSGKAGEQRIRSRSRRGRPGFILRLSYLRLELLFRFCFNLFLNGFDLFRSKGSLITAVNDAVSAARLIRTELGRIFILVQEGNLLY